MGIKFDKRNYRKHSDKNKELINKSLEECGAGRSILIDADDEIIAGNGVYEQAQALNIPVKVIETDGTELIAVKRTDLNTDDERRKRLAVMDNSTSDSSEFDLELLSVDFEVPELKDMGIDVPDVEIEEKEVVEDEVPEEVETRCKLGDIWQLGEHRLMCGDSTKADDVEKLMNGESNYMVFTDPPYGFNYVKKSDKASIKNDGEEFEFVIKNAISLTNTKTYFICGDIKTARAFLRATQLLGEPKTAIVWSKPLQHHMHKFEPCYELIWYWGDNSSKEFYGKNVFECKREIDKMHPTIKPQELICYCLKSQNEKNVLDLFGGSGSTLIACEQLNRKCFMMELDEHYCDVIITRWENLTGKTAERIADENN